MNFGDKIRQLRTDRNLTQPELAVAMGIEQSYLSKLENGKSLPSNDMLQRILDVFEMDVADLVDDLDQGVRNQLRQIPAVAEHYNRQKQVLIGNRRRWLLASSALVALGVALIYAGYVHLFFSNTVYDYVSHGIVLEGESREIFSPTTSSPPVWQDSDAANAKRNELYSRRDEQYLQLAAFAGLIFNVDVEGGSRTYYLQRQTEIDPWQNKAVTFVGVFMAVFGLIGLFLEKKLARNA